MTGTGQLISRFRHTALLAWLCRVSGTATSGSTPASCGSVRKIVALHARVVTSFPSQKMLIQGLALVSQILFVHLICYKETVPLDKMAKDWCCVNRRESFQEDYIMAF